MSGVYDKQTAWRYAAWIAALFCVALGGMLVFGHVTTRQQDPLKSPELKQLKEKLRSSPRDEALKERIRQLDLQLRKTYFHQLARTETGIWLLLGGAAIFVVSLRQTQKARAQLPIPGEAATPQEMDRSRSAARFGVVAVACAVAVGFAVSSTGPGKALPERPEQIDKLLGGHHHSGSSTSRSYRRNIGGTGLVFWGQMETAMPRAPSHRPPGTWLPAQAFDGRSRPLWRDSTHL